jgi:glycosyltransferase involved in cell wall biosynthesis
VLHIDLGESFRGGQRQVFYLARYLKENGIDTGCVVASGGELERRLRDIGVNTFPIKYRGYDVVRESMRLRRVCSEMGYNIVHAHDSHGHNIALTTAFIDDSIRVVVTRRVISGKPKNMASRFKYTSPSIALFIAVSTAVEGELLDWGVSDRKVVHIPSGVDMRYFGRVETDGFRKRHGIPDRKFYIGTASALDHNKDIDTLVNAISKLSYDRDDYILLVAGDGERRSEIEKLIEFIEVGDRVMLLGHVDEMPEFYSLLDVFVLSSRSEGLGTSLIEAGACGSALVVSDCGGPLDFVEEAVTGFVFPVENDEKLYKILATLLDDEQLRKRTATEAANRASRYDIEIVCKEVVEQYNRIALQM